MAPSRLAEEPTRELSAPAGEPKLSVQASPMTTGQIQPCAWWFARLTSLFMSHQLHLYLGQRQREKPFDSGPRGQLFPANAGTVGRMGVPVPS